MLRCVLIGRGHVSPPPSLAPSLVPSLARSLPPSLLPSLPLAPLLPVRPPVPLLSHQRRFLALQLDNACARCPGWLHFLFYGAPPQDGQHDLGDSLRSHIHARLAASWLPFGLSAIWLPCAHSHNDAHTCTRACTRANAHAHATACTRAHAHARSCPDLHAMRA